jgi:hypothetical protein
MPMFKSFAARRPSSGCLAATLAVLLVTAGCQALDPRAEATAETYGYRWIGQGEPASFGTANSFCRQTVQAENFSALPTWDMRGSSMVSYTTPDTGIAGPSYRGGYAQRREFDSCMRSQGWAPAAMMPAGRQPATIPEPSAAPVPVPSPAPSPVR